MRDLAVSRGILQGGRFGGSFRCRRHVEFEDSGNHDDGLRPVAVLSCGNIDPTLLATVLGAA